MATLPPLMVRYAFRVGKAGRDLSHAENISLMTVADREACEPFLPPSPNLAHADGDSIITDLLADDVIRWADICRPAP
jgi:superfamily II DNA helicase RecQ